MVDKQPDPITPSPSPLPTYPASQVEDEYFQGCPVTDFCLRKGIQKQFNMQLIKFNAQKERDKDPRGFNCKIHAGLSATLGQLFRHDLDLRVVANV